MHAGARAIEHHPRANPGGHKADVSFGRFGTQQHGLTGISRPIIVGIDVDNPPGLIASRRADRIIVAHIGTWAQHDRGDPLDRLGASGLQ